MKHNGKVLKKIGQSKVIDCKSCKFIHVVPLPTEIELSQHYKKNYYTKHWNYEIKNLGYKYNMNDLMAAIGLAQLKKINVLNRKRSNIIKKYLLGIKNCKHVKPVYPYDLKNSSYWLFSLKSKYRDQFVNFLKKKNISTAVHFVPLPLNKIYKKYNNNLKNAMKIWKEIFSVPFSLWNI